MLLTPNKNLFFSQLNRSHVSLKEKSHDYPHLSTDITYDSTVGINPSPSLPFPQLIARALLFLPPPGNLPQV